MCHPEAADSEEQAGAPDEIEVTPAMIEAGVAALEEFNCNEDNLEWIVSAVFEEMTKASYRHWDSTIDPLTEATIFSGRLLSRALPKPNLSGHKPTEPMVVYDVHKSGEIYHYLLGVDGSVASFRALNK